MGDEDSRSEFIRANLPVLIKSTVVGTEFVAFLFSKGLVDEEEKELLSNGTPNIKRADLLYSTIENKWNQSQFEDFITILGDTKNLHALQVFTNAGAESFLTNEQVQLLREQLHESESGCYAGLFQEDEVKANRIVQIVRGDGKSGLFSKDADGKLKLSVGWDRKEVLPLVKHFEKCLKNGVVWWNPRKPRLPLKYIERSVGRTHLFRPDGTLPTPVQLQRLEEIIEESSFVLLVDPPGMGKSSEISDLENKLRKKVPTNRVILRVNLNEVQKELATISPSESASSVLLKLSPFIPANILSTVGVRVFVLLDSLDEVCPEHKDTMINLLRIFTSASEPTFGKNLRVVVTTRPHLRESVEKEFHLESWSLLPLTEEEQDEYMKSVLEVSDEQLNEFRNNLAHSVADLLSNPLMLSMFVDVIPEGTFPDVDELNIFELYTKYVDKKHKRLLVEKEGMRAENNFTKMSLEGMLKRSLPHYYRVAIRELVEQDEDSDSEDDDSEDEGNEYRPRRLILAECKESGVVAQDKPTGVTRDELLSIGLLVEGPYNPLVFKHRSFAEYFYARLLTQEESASQVAKDALFGYIYAPNDYELENVEAFLEGALSNLSKRRRTTTGGYGETSQSHPPSLLLSLTPEWLSLNIDITKRCHTLCTFAGSSLSFPHLVSQVLLNFFHGHPDDLREAHEVLFDERSRGAIRDLFDWMSENIEWTREQLLNINQFMRTTPPPSHPPVDSATTAKLILVIGLHFEGQQLFSEEELGAVVNSVGKFIRFVAQAQLKGSGRSKWEWAEGLLYGGRRKLRRLFKQMDGEECRLVIGDQESAFKLVSTLSPEEIFTLISNNETRVSDVIGEIPLWLCMALGEEFVPPKQLAEFRGKFGGNQEKTIFEMRGVCEFALDYLWDDLLGEIRRGDPGGFVTVALREALGKMPDSWQVLRSLETEVRRRLRSCLEQQSQTLLEEKEVMDWVTQGLQWSHSLTLRTLAGLPFFLRYYDNVDPKHLTSFLMQNEGELKYSCELIGVLRSLVIVSSPRFHESSLFSILTAFLQQEDFSKMSSDCKGLDEVFLGATREQIAVASYSPSFQLVEDLSVRRVARKLFTPQEHPPLHHVIQFTPCCNFLALLHQIYRQMEEQNKSEKLRKEVFTSKHVLWGWRERFQPKHRVGGWEGKKDVNSCGVRNFLSFYFFLFGVNCDWMKLEDGLEVEADKWKVVGRLPVEISNALRGNPHWTHLLPKFQEILREHLRKKGVVSVGGVAEKFCYETEGEWETLLPLINGKTLLPEVREKFTVLSIPAAVAAPYIRTLIKLYGVEWTKSRLKTQIWNKIPSEVQYKDKEGNEMWFNLSSVPSLRSLLQSAIELGDLKEEKQRSWPGLLSSRSS